VTYNLRCGGSPGNLVTLFEFTDPAVVLLQEELPPHRLLTADALEHWHVHWQGASSTWGSAIMSRMPITRVIEFPGFAGWAVGAVVAGDLLGSPEVLVVSLHAPTRGSGTDYVGEIDRFLTQLRPVTEQMPLILGGDFNFKSLGRRLESESIQVTASEERVLRRLQDEFGLVNCWEESHPQEPLGQTLRWFGNRANPYHCDGIFGPEAWRARLVRTEIISGPSWESLSDHNPVAALLTRA
jgi:endonuclease/exonuclease/phosphatase family metal-dependent hydrolase